MAFLKKTNRFFASPKTIILLLSLFLAACLAGVLIPQTTSSTPAYFAAWQAKSPYSYYLVKSLQLDRVFTSCWFLFLIFFLLPAVGFSVHGQFRKALLASNAKPSFKFTPQAVFKTDISPAAALGNVLGKKRFQAQERREGSTLLLNFSRNRQNVWGSFIFHSGILLIILAALLTFSCQKRGFVQLIEGDTFLGREEGFLSSSKGILAGRFDPAFAIRLERFSHTYWDTGELKEVQSDITIDRPGLPFRTSLRRGTPLSIDGVALYQSADFGYTLKISYIPGGKTGDVIPTYFSLDMAPAGKALKGTSDFPTTDYILDMTFFPDRGGRSPYPVNPYLEVRFMRGEREVGRAALKPGEEALVDGSRFRFEEVRNWSGLILTENRFIALVYGGFLMNALGLFMMFFFVPQEILVSRTAEKDGGFSVAVAVKTKMGSRALLADIVERIKESLGTEATKG